MNASSIYKHEQQELKGYTFNLLVAERNSHFAKQLKNVINECWVPFPDIDFKIDITNDPNNFKLDEMYNKHLVFIEDEFLLNVPKQDIVKTKAKKDIVLLIDGHFTGEEAFKIKQAIDENSLNLAGHISLTNYSFNLVKMLVIDFIKSKVH